jgi:(R,R)-butanediol dehydrogenase / meso-butanediol dehydrogenase / diacetyl reductase
MHAALITGLETVELREFPSPTPAEGGLVVDIAFCGVCGTDIHAYQSGRDYRPSICGHEWTGTVSAVGAGVTTVCEGDRVVVAVAGPCGKCRPCETGDPSHCSVAFMSAIGADPLAPKHGGFAPQIAVGESKVMRAHGGLSDRTLGQIEPATVTLHAVRRSGLQPGQLVVVQGGGPIGLLTFQWAKALGAGHVVVVEPSEPRAALARDLGADSVVAPGEAAKTRIAELAGGLGGADLVFECVGSGPAVQWGADLVRRGGELCLVGVPTTDATISPANWIVKELRLSTSIAFERHEFAQAMDRVADGQVRLDEMHTQTVPLAGLAGALADLASGSSSHMKVLVDPRI